MKKFLILLFLVISGIFVSKLQAQQTNNETMVLITTKFGDMKLMLYNDTPEHKQNFIKLINEGFYDGVLFHRVMNNFMIQGGDPNSKNAKSGERLGTGNVGYTIPAEIVPTYFHKKGALAAARRGDDTNPEKRSSGSQFYIVHGEVMTNAQLDTMEIVLNNRAKNVFYKECFEVANDELNAFRKNDDREGFNTRVAEIRAEADSIWENKPLFTFTPQQREAYTTVGGYPSLDNEYTVFGQLIEGFEVLDKIAAVETDRYNRPVADIEMKIEVIKQ